MRRAAVQKLLDTQTREHGKHVATLLQVISEQNDRLMHLAGRTWQPAPADKRELEPLPDRYSASPEQFVDLHS